MKKIYKFDIRKDDTIRVITGKDKGKNGRVLKVNHETRNVTVENVMMSTQHKKKMGQKRGQSGIQKIPTPIDVSNVMLVCPRCNKPTKVTRIEVKGKRIRQCRSCEEYIDQV
jgi:large subunit ribosomal protein L24